MYHASTSGIVCTSFSFIRFYCKETRVIINRFQQLNNLQYSCRYGKRFLSAVDSSTINNEESSSITNNIPPRLSVAIVGAGPSGFYSAKYLTSSLLKQIQSATSNSAAEQSIADKEHKSLWSGIDIDMIERLPTPYGLVRYGVAPDHPEVKNVENDFASLFIKKGGGGDGSVSGDASISYFGFIFNNFSNNIGAVLF